MNEENKIKEGELFWGGKRASCVCDGEVLAFESHGVSPFEKEKSIFFSEIQIVSYSLFYYFFSIYFFLIFFYNVSMILPIPTLKVYLGNYLSDPMAIKSGRLDSSHKDHKKTIQNNFGSTTF